jgi:hypothetical protein
MLWFAAAAGEEDNCGRQEGQNRGSTTPILDSISDKGIVVGSGDLETCNALSELHLVNSAG